MASELRLGLSENYYFFEGWAVGGTRILSMVDRLLEICSVKLFSFALHGGEIHNAPFVCAG